MLANQGIKVEFTFSGSYLIEVAPDTYQWYYHVLTYDAWLYMNSDDNIYLHIENIVKNDEKEKKIERPINLPALVLFVVLILSVLLYLTTGLRYYSALLFSSSFSSHQSISFLNRKY